MRTVRSIASVLFLGAAATTLAACPDGQQADRAQFAQATAQQRAALVPIALDIAGERAANLVSLAEIDHAAGAACPSRTVNDDTVVYEAKGCQGAASGISWSGRIEAKNSFRTALLGRTIDTSKPEELRFVDLHADRVDAPLAIDGVLSIGYGANKGDENIHNQLTVTTSESVRLALFVACALEDGARVCRVAPGSEGGELIGLGRFDIVATLKAENDKFTGTFSLRGEDVLAVDTAARDGQDCIPYQIAGKDAGSVCLPELTAADTSTVDGVSWTCADDNGIDVTGFAQGKPVYAKVELRNGQTQQQIELSFRSRDAQTQVDRWESAATALTAGLTCTQLNDAGVRVVAFYPDGSTSCHETGAFGAFDGQACF